MSEHHGNLEPDTFGSTDAEHVQMSIAVSLKRIADLLDGTALGLCITETIFNPQTVQNREVRNNY